MYVHTVAPGETLYSISALYGIPVGRILEDNGLTDAEGVVVGQSLVILTPRQTYTARAGDTVASVAAAFSLTERRLLRNNPDLIGDPALFPGRTLIISFEGETLGAARSSGYAYPFIGRELLGRALPYLSDLIVFTYGFDAQGNLVYPQADDTATVEAAVRAGSFPVLLLSTLTGEGTFDNRLSSALFASPEAEENLIGGLLAVMGEKGYRGLEIDFEYVEPSERVAYADFVRRTTGRMNDAGYEVTIALAPKTFRTQPGLLYEAHDYALLGQAANYAMLMTYEWGYTYGPPMAVAPIDRVRAVADYAESEIPPEKILLGIPNYGYDWTLPYTPGTAARSLSPGEAVELARSTGSEILFDERAASPFFYYTDDAGRAHVVWFEDARSFEAKLRLVAEKGFDGFAVWTVMRPAQTLLSEANALFALVDRPE